MCLFCDMGTQNRPKSNPTLTLPLAAPLTLSPFGSPAGDGPHQPPSPAQHPYPVSSLASLASRERLMDDAARHAEPAAAAQPPPRLLGPLRCADCQRSVPCVCPLLTRLTRHHPNHYMDAVHTVTLGQVRGGQ
jgi:hypothetical protein